MIARRFAAFWGMLILAALLGCDKGGCGLAPYSIDPPADWQKDEECDASARYVSPAEGGADDFREYFEVRYVPPPGRSHTAEYAGVNLSRLSDELDDFRELSREDVEINDAGGVKAVYTYTEDGKGLKAQAYFFLHKATGLVVTFVATEESYDRYAATFHATAGTLRLEE